MNGEEVQGIRTSGWGSMAKIKADEQDDSVLESAERELAPQDKLFAAFYLKSL